ncbi:crossover junction endodeoxyribonuclease RuvC [Arsenicicoccus dermatophilus]|uniref:crossover junction endodeoxyribonuclease RuvC n=1 Tax=Arsenicicoccus dermatophilus TaxID=1076331 RepID=UPI001F4CB050|nr:crossover junction endodeoxyribonuclease RuvC [Arsenicicoccus dermatophilus]MCH8613035.1 crossover junction endodeoxyribonuclease RuvC [Arsenicicoccus dermatophilus]
MRVLGVDPGLTRCGIGVVEGVPGRPLRMVAVGVIRTPSTDPVHQRLLTLQVELDEWLHAHDPDAIAVERMFARGDVANIMGTAQASAVPMLAAARRGLPLALHTPSEVKAAVTGNGRADKAQVTTMVMRVLGLDERPTPADAADALALAICQVWRGGAASRLESAVADSRVAEALDAARRRQGEAPNRWQQAVAQHRASAGGSDPARAAAVTAVRRQGVTRGTG